MNKTGDRLGVLIDGPGVEALRDFFRRVYHIVAQIPPGRVATYGQIARWLGSPRAARTVGWAMWEAPPELRLPCHRVVNGRGELAPPHVFGGEGRQRALLEAEGVAFLPDGRIDLRRHLVAGRPEPEANIIRED